MKIYKATEHNGCKMTKCGRREEFIEKGGAGNRKHIKTPKTTCHMGIFAVCMINHC